MNVWLLSANSRIYNHQRAFEEQGYIDWKQTRNFSVGDIVYIYLTKPSSRIRYKTTVVAIDLPPYIDGFWNVKLDISSMGKQFMRLSLDSICDSQSLTFEELQKHGMRYAPQSPGKVSKEIQNYLTRCFEEGK